MDFNQIQSIIDQFEKSSIADLLVEHDGTKLALKRAVAVEAAVSQSSVVPVASAPTTPNQPSSHSQDTADPDVEVIAAPIVGTMYRSAAPDAPPFCHEGDIVEKGKTLCIIEAMKVMNELEAEFTMEVVSFEVSNGEMVEYGTPLIHVRRV